MNGPPATASTVLVALRDAADRAAVVGWARSVGSEVIVVADADSALENALESGRATLIVLDANSEPDTLVAARTLMAVSEHPIGLVLAACDDDWRRLADLELDGVETMRRPLCQAELDWRARRALAGADPRRRAESGALTRISAAVRLLSPSDDTVPFVLGVLQETYPGLAIAIARWRGDGSDLFDAVELARTGRGQPVWSEIRAALRGGDPLVSTLAARAASMSGLVVGARVAAVAAVPIGGAGAAQRGALVAWSAGDWPPGHAIAELLGIAAGRLAIEFELTRLRERSRRQSARDALTRLANRAQFNADLAQVVRAARESGERFAVLLVNLDRFKTINEAYGHALADRVLVECSRRIRQAVRGTDIVARYAGDEFSVCLRDLRARGDAEAVAGKLRAALAEPLPLGEGVTADARVTASIGICHYPDEAVHAEDLVRQADIALRAGKSLGTDQTHVFVADLRESRRERAALESRLREAEARGELRLHYQPQVSARDEDVIGVEALVRWEHPELGVVSPGSFIPLAEETGLIVPIGRWVLFEACRQMREWQQRFGVPLRVAVNLSAVQLGRRELVADVTAALAETGLPPETLELEVTETVSVKRIPHLIESLEALRSLGCQIAIDDFGTGQASLDYIRRFPADRIKIDQVFVRNIGIDPDDEAIVRATIGMAHSLGRQVVAEGVEYEQHATFLREQGCDELQGFLFCRPLPPPALEDLLAERERLLDARH
jgi:diguanylate cyclase (GGDEF)-like protein